MFSLLLVFFFYRVFGSEDLFFWALLRIPAECNYVSLDFQSITVFQRALQSAAGLSSGWAMEEDEGVGGFRS